MIREQSQDLSFLRRQWLLVALVYGAALLLGYDLLNQSAEPQQSLQWLTLAATATAIQLGILWWALPHNRRQGHSLAKGESPLLLPALGYANAITLLRGLFTCMLAGFLFAPQPLGWLAWMPALLYTLERLVDFADGYVARITRRETRLGEILDIEFDGLGILIAILLGIQYGKLPPWYLLLGLARPLFVLCMWLLRRGGRPVYDLPFSEHRRMIAGFQTGFITVVLWPLWPPEVTLLAAYVMAIPLIFSFGRDWLVVSGVIDATSQGYQRARQRGKHLIEGWLPLVARMGAALLALPILWHSAPAFAPWQGGIAGVGVEGSTLVFGGLILLGLLAVVSVVLGAAARTGALVLAAIAALDIAASGLQWDSNELLLICALIVVHLGSGKGALWRPEEPLLRAKAGTPRA
jgi:CDP-diacylglycerol--glycerol-3-phosphate 3-phosphatidyltransferase